MSRRHKKYRRKKTLLPRFSTVILIVVLGLAAWFAKEMYNVKTDVDNIEREKLESDLVKKTAEQFVSATNKALDLTALKPMEKALVMKQNIDSLYLMRLDTFLLKDKRYNHFYTVIEETTLLHRISDNDSTNYYDSLAILMNEYSKIEQLPIADSCKMIAIKLTSERNQ
ncbi:MAG: hypothetical protein E7081_00950 [Bacteroidales bacterium]|nr:hypothetical protein [Bacteroidales bacterium]